MNNRKLTQIARKESGQSVAKVTRIAMKNIVVLFNIFGPRTQKQIIKQLKQINK